jgi:hypothetical protein
VLPDYRTVRLLSLGFPLSISLTLACKQCTLSLVSSSCKCIYHSTEFGAQAGIPPGNTPDFETSASSEGLGVQGKRMTSNLEHDMYVPRARHVCTISTTQITMTTACMLQHVWYTKSEDILSHDELKLLNITMNAFSSPPNLMLTGRANRVTCLRSRSDSVAGSCPKRSIHTVKVPRSGLLRSPRRNVVKAIPTAPPANARNTVHAS